MDKYDNLYRWVHQLFSDEYEKDEKLKEIYDRWNHYSAEWGDHLEFGKGPSLFVPYSKNLNAELHHTVKQDIDRNITPLYKLSRHYNIDFKNKNSSICYLFESFTDKDLGNKENFDLVLNNQINKCFDDGTVFLSFHGKKNGFYLPFVDDRMRIMSEKGPFDRWLQEKYTKGRIKVKQTDTVIDCGAFVGAFAIYAFKAEAEKVMPVLDDHTAKIRRLYEQVSALETGASKVNHKINDHSTDIAALNKDLALANSKLKAV